MQTTKKKATAIGGAVVALALAGCLSVSNGTAACDDTNDRLAECLIQNTAGCSDWSDCSAACVEAASCDELRAWSGVGNEAKGPLLACLKSCASSAP